MLSQRIFASSFLGSKLSLKKAQTTTEGYSSADLSLKNLIGQEGIAETVLRPSGTVTINDELYDAKAQYGYIERGGKVKVIKYESNQLYVIKTE